MELVTSVGPSQSLDLNSSKCRFILALMQSASFQENLLILGLLARRLHTSLISQPLVAPSSLKKPHTDTV